jgi:YbbR domain-containing protein
MTDSPWLVLLSSVVAVLLWLWVQGQQLTSARVRVDLDVRVADNLVNTAPTISSASAVVQGPLSAIRRAQLLRPSVVVDLTRERTGVHQVPLEGMPVVGLPAGLGVAGLSPEVLEVRLEPRVRRTVKVNGVVEGAPGEGLAVGVVSVDPSEVVVSGSRSAVSALDAVPTRPVGLAAWTVSGDAPVELELPAGVELVEAWTGKVKVEIVAERATLTVSDVPVVVRGAAGWRAAPGSERVSVTVEGPATVLRSLGLDRVIAVVDLPPEASAARYTARFRAGRAPRLDILLPREDVLVVVTPPPSVEIVRE